VSRPVSLIAAAAALVFSGQAALAADAPIGLMAPLSGNFEILGKQMQEGAAAAAQAKGVELAIADDRCDAEGGASAARELIARDVALVVGGLCSEAMDAALPLLTEASIPVISTGVRADRFTDLREREGWLFWRVAPRDDAERSAAADILVPLWRNDLFAIVDDGTIYGRELAETLRLAAEVAGLKPAFVDTFRPQSENQFALIGRLTRAGATNVFVGGDRDDIGIIARDAAEAKAELTIAGGEMLRAPSGIPLRAGVLMVGMPEGSPELEGYAFPAHAAVEIAAAALTQAGDDMASIQELLSRSEFQTVMGPVKFDAKGDLSRNPYRLHRFDGEKFVIVEDQR